MSQTLAETTGECLTTFTEAVWFAAALLVMCVRAMGTLTRLQIGTFKGGFGITSHRLLLPLCVFAGEWWKRVQVISYSMRFQEIFCLRVCYDSQAKEGSKILFSVGKVWQSVSHLMSLVLTANSFKYLLAYIFKIEVVIKGTKTSLGPQSRESGRENKFCCFMSLFSALETLMFNWQKLSLKFPT
jgi:hypothetical protein